MNWDDLDWAALDRLRECFLAGAASSRPYWSSREELASYDFTFGRRIGWKWDAVLRELDLRHWRPPPAMADSLPRVGAPQAVSWRVLDWGCGSGIAGRRVVDWLGPDRVIALGLWDRSRIAVDFAATAAAAAFPALLIEEVTPGFLDGDEPVGVLVISHVLNELPADQLFSLRNLIGRADSVLWVEPGTHEVSRSLIEVRELLRERFRVVAPCTHQAACGLRTAGNARHWCHHFAPTPPEIHADPHWASFARRAGIDLRSVPYSFLTLERRESGRDTTPGMVRVIGEPRLYKGFARVLACDGDGVTEVTVQKRDAPALFRQLGRSKDPHLYRWQRREGRIVGAAPIDDLGPSDTDRGPSR